MVERSRLAVSRREGAVSPYQRDFRFRAAPRAGGASASASASDASMSSDASDAAALSMMQDTAGVASSAAGHEYFSASACRRDRERERTRGGRSGRRQSAERRLYTLQTPNRTVPEPSATVPHHKRSRQLTFSPPSAALMAPALLAPVAAITTTLAFLMTSIEMASWCFDSIGRTILPLPVALVSSLPG